MNAKLLIFCIVVFCIATFLAIYFFPSGTQENEILENMTNDVLDQLEQKLEFCDIVHNEIDNYSGIGRFWMMCNGRPFYAEYENGNVSYSLNGWSWLENTQYWNELDGCDYYDTRDSKLVFYCPKDFDSTTLTAKLCSFDDKNFHIENIEDDDMLNILKKDISSIYRFLSDCEIESYDSFKPENYPAVLKLNFKCEDGYYMVATDLSTVPIQPPILMYSTLPYEDVARISFEKAFNLKIDKIENYSDTVIIESGNLTITYKLSGGSSTAGYMIVANNEEEVEEQIKHFGRFFIFPPLVMYYKIDSLGEINRNVFAYKIGDKDIISVNWLGTSKIINAFWLKTGRLYR
jgi:hypothetical protein